jgi:hypothetical protein
MELNKDLGRGAGEGAKLPPRIDWPPKAAGLRSVSGAQVMEEVAGRASAGDVKRADIEVIAQGIKGSGRHGAKVGALGEATTDQTVELLDAALVGCSVGPGKEHTGRSVQRGGNPRVIGELSAVVQGERAKGSLERTQQQDQGVGHGVAALIEHPHDPAEAAFALSQDQQKALGVQALDQVAFPMPKLAALIGRDGPLADVAAIRDRAASPAAGSAAGTTPTRQMPVKRAASRPVHGDQPVATALARANGQQSDLPGGKALTQQPGEHRNRFLGSLAMAATASPRVGQPLGLRVIVVCRWRGCVAAQLPAHRRVGAPQGTRYGSSTASGLSHDLDSMAFTRRQLLVVFLTHTWSSGFAEAKLQAVDAVFMPLGLLLHFTRQDAKQVIHL